MQENASLRAEDFHVFKHKDTWYLFLTIPVAVFQIDSDTGRLLKRYKTGGMPANDAEQERLAKAHQFATDLAG